MKTGNYTGQSRKSSCKVVKRKHGVSRQRKQHEQGHGRTEVRGVFRVITQPGVAAMKGTEMGARGVTFVKDLECQAKKCGSHPESIEEFLE